eukprot:2382585-Alexandrium_andersonii.AAC.1
MVGSSPAAGNVGLRWPSRFARGLAGPKLAQGDFPHIRLALASTPRSQRDTTDSSSLKESGMHGLRPDVPKEIGISA